MKPYSPPRLRELRTSRCRRKDRFRVFLGKGHPFATASGQQWRYRLLVMLHLGRPLRQDEQVDHRDGNRQRDVIENLQVLLCDKEWNHHWHRHEIAVVAEHVDELGYVEYAQPMPVRTPF